MNATLTSDNGNVPLSNPPPGKGYYLLFGNPPNVNLTSGTFEILQGSYKSSALANPAGSRASALLTLAVGVVVVVAGMS